MPRWLADPSFLTYCVLVLAVLLGGVRLLLKQNRSALLLFAGCLVALVGLFLVDTFWDSGRERANSQVQAMAEATRQKRYSEILPRLTADFRVRSIGKNQLANRFQQIDTTYGWEGAEVWDFDRSEVKYITDDRVEIGFMSKAKGYNALFYCRSTFQREADGDWRMQTLELYHPLNRTNAPPVDVPGLGR
ncbi:hypothetical protein [Tuwongella immobilis]|uniref:DUF4440 domain-containing protein n=1 Tax=Tuwongella immobilis TaxID=692036 RepID=A0A6C2YNR2_9BACT|nr:hypothetical protein [Tuwongella immobilis]VIP03007.1 unnamed protein product [Tuwongella immobilis]VTS03108.1 unnamed protein product [Tuwongella immobilis]